MKLGPYDVEDAVGSGATGTVYRARSPRGELVAVKVLERVSAQAFARFERERRLHASLRTQAGFVPLLDAGDEAGKPFLVMPFVPGGTLRDRLVKGRLPIDESVRLVLALAQALAGAHERALVHRDMKPENVLFTTDGAPLVADLGLAKHIAGAGASTASLSRTGELRGTAGYAPVEQIHDAKLAGAPADVFALGAILYECLAGVPAFAAASIVELLAKVEEGDFAPLEGLRPDTPAWLLAIVERCLASDARERFPDAGALARALAARGRAPDRFETARPTPVLVAVVGLGFALAFLAWAVLHARAPRPGPPPPPPSTPPSPPLAPRDPALAGSPSWFLALDPGSRPRWPIAGLSFGEKAGEYVNDKDGSVLVFVPRGRFFVGPGSRETGGFFLGKYEVTNVQFASFVAATGHKTEAERRKGGLVVVESTAGKEKGSYWRAPRGQGALETPAPADYPVLQMWWSDAVAYSSWAGLRLPTLDEWQKAAGWDPIAHSAHVYPWGNDAPGESAYKRTLGDLADQSFIKKWLETPKGASPYDDGFERAAPVSAFPQSASSYGALELGGDAAEWIVERYDHRLAQSVPDALIEPSRRFYYAVVGASFADYPPRAMCRVTNAPRKPRAPREDFGFRVCRSEE